MTANSCCWPARVSCASPSFSRSSRLISSWCTADFSSCCSFSRIGRALPAFLRPGPPPRRTFGSGLETLMLRSAMVAYFLFWPQENKPFFAGWACFIPSDPVIMAAHFANCEVYSVFLSEEIGSPTLMDQAFLVSVRQSDLYRHPNGLLNLLDRDCTM